MGESEHGWRVYIENVGESNPFHTRPVMRVNLLRIRDAGSGFGEGPILLPLTPVLSPNGNLLSFSSRLWGEGESSTQLRRFRHTHTAGQKVHLVSLCGWEGEAPAEPRL